MTKQIFTELINTYGGAEKVVSLVFDNDKIENFVNGKRFSLDMVKTYGGMDFIELTKALRSDSMKGSGTYDIETKTLHKLECLQCIGFVTNADQMDLVDPAQFVHIY